MRGMGRKSSIAIVLSPAERAELERRARSLVLSHRDVVRARLVLHLAAGRSFTVTAKAVGMNRRIVHKWANRFVDKRVDGLEDAKRSGRPPRFSPCRGDASCEDGVRVAR
jgi:hypothetical protein